MIKYSSDGYPEGHPDHPGSNPHPGHSADRVREHTPPVSKQNPGGRDRAFPNSDPNHESNWSYHHEHPYGHDSQAEAGRFLPDEYHLDHGSTFRHLEHEYSKHMLREGHEKAGISPSEAHPHPDEALPVRGDDDKGIHADGSSGADHNDVGKLGPSKQEAGHFKNHLTNRNNVGPQTWQKDSKAQQ